MAVVEIAVWPSSLHYESLQRHYTAVGAPPARRRRWLWLTALVLSSGAAAAPMTELPLNLAGTLAVTALTISLELANYSSNAARCIEVATELGELATAMHSLSIRLDRLSREEAGRACCEPDERTSAVTRHMPAKLTDYRSIRIRAERETYAYHTGAEDAIAGA